MQHTRTVRLRFIEEEVSMLNAAVPHRDPRLPALPTRAPLRPGEPYDFTRGEVFKMRAELGEYRTHLVGVLPVFERLNLSYTADLRNDIERLDRLDHDLRDILNT